MKAYKVKLDLNNKQRTQLMRNASVSRFMFNFTLGLQEENYKCGGKFLHDNDVRKLVTQRKKHDLSWLYQFDCDIAKQAIKDACKAYISFFKKISKKPVFKSRKKTKPSFYVDTHKIEVRESHIKIPKLGKLRLHEKGYVPYSQDVKIKYYNPRIMYDGVDWFLSICVDKQKMSVELTEEVVGIDVGIKTIATCSNGMALENFTKNIKHKRIISQKKRLQKQTSRKYHLNRENLKFKKTKNISKLERRIRKIQIHLNNIKTDNYHKFTTALVKTKPKCIILEDLNLQGMMKNKHLAHKFQDISLYLLKTMLISKCEEYSIDVIEANRFFPSSKLCSNCGSKKDDLSLKDRTYHCNDCGMELDRDLNASINLSKYREFHGNQSLWRTKQSSSSRKTKEGSSNKESNIEADSFL